MLTLHRGLNTWTECVDLYLALTEFARGKFIQGGIPANKIVVKPHFVSPDPGEGRGGGEYAVFVGRLTEEKGIHTVVEAWRTLGSVLPLRIIGDGPLMNFVLSAAHRGSGIQVEGWQSPEAVTSAMKAAKVVVVPSLWYETFGLVVI